MNVLLFVSGSSILPAWFTYITAGVTSVIHAGNVIPEYCFDKALDSLKCFLQLFAVEY